jgi:SOS-response transcriptional repressor LexA
VTPAQIRVLLAVVCACEANPWGTCTVREAMSGAGLKSPNTTHLHLRRLRAGGWVSWEDEKQGTLRANLRRVA